MQFYKSYYLLVLLFGHKLSFTKAAINMNSKQLDMHDWQLQINLSLSLSLSLILWKKNQNIKKEEKNAAQNVDAGISASQTVTYL